MFINKIGYFYISFILCLLIITTTGCKDSKDTEKNETISLRKKILQIDTDSSKIKWTILRNTGYLTGSIKFAKGTINMDEYGIPVDGNISVDAESVTIDNIKDTELNKKTVELVKSANFFNTEKYKTMDFIVRSFLPLRYGGMPGKNGTVKGSINVKHLSVPVALTVSVKYRPDAIEVAAIQSLSGPQWELNFPEFQPDASFKSNPLKNDVEVDYFILAK